jgi:hypothetical protein
MEVVQSGGPGEPMDESLGPLDDGGLFQPERVVGRFTPFEAENPGIDAFPAESGVEALHLHDAASGTGILTVNQNDLHH